jgi:uncharacterized membrane-anchored protein/uncharacterized membrane protein
MRPEAQPLKTTLRVTLVMAALGALLVGLGAVFWVAANWQDWPRQTQFVMLQALVVASLGVAAWRHRNLPARLALSLLGLLAIGGLFAFFGQTYQTGADPWQLFAWWAALAVPLAWGARHDLVWSAWVLVAMTAIGLWAHAHLGRMWFFTWIDPQHPAWVLPLAIAAAVGLVGGVSALTARWTGAGVASLRLAVLLTATMLTSTAIPGLFAERVHPHYYMALMALALLLLAFHRLPRLSYPHRTMQAEQPDTVVLGLLGLAGNVLLVAGAARWVFKTLSMGPIAGFAGVALFALLLFWITGSWLMRAVRERPAAAALPASATRAASTALAQPVPTDAPAWSTVAIQAIGALFTALPVLLFFGFVLGRTLMTSGGALVLGVGLLVVTGLLLRQKSLVLFVELLALPFMLAGGALTAFGLFQLKLEPTAVALILLAVSIGLAALVRPGWLKAMLGVVAAFALATAVRYAGAHHVVLRSGMAMVALLGAWSLMLVWLRPSADGSASHSTTRGWVDLFAQGFGVGAVLVGIALSGPSFLISGALLGGGELLGSADGMDPGALASWSARWRAQPWVMVGSPVLAAAACVLAWRTHPVLRLQPMLLAMTVLVVLAVWMPLLGAMALLVTLSSMTLRWKTAMLAGIGVLWIVGAFYYQLSWPLVDKAVVLVASGLVLGLSAAWWHRRMTQGLRLGHPNASLLVPRRRAVASLALSALATVAVVNKALGDKEQLITHGEPVLVELGPRDPRSRMQGDFMALTPPSMPMAVNRTLGATKPVVIARRDARGVATIERLDEDPRAAMPPGLIRIELTPKHGQWFIASDAWFFKEGQAKRFEAARFGEYRVLPNGRALLVGLRNDQLQPL